MANKSRYLKRNQVNNVIVQRKGRTVQIYASGVYLKYDLQQILNMHHTQWSVMEYK